MIDLLMVAMALAIDVCLVLEAWAPHVLQTRCAEPPVIEPVASAQRRSARPVDRRR